MNGFLQQKSVNCYRDLYSEPSGQINLEFVGTNKPVKSVAVKENSLNEKQREGKFAFADDGSKLFVDNQKL
jgi:hypothetical protein